MQEPSHIDIKLSDPQPKGLGGWLILPSIGLLVSPLYMAKTMYDSYAPLMKEETLELLVNTQLHSQNSGLLAMMGLELFTNIAFILFTLAIIPKFFKKQASAPKLMAIWYAISFSIQFLDVILIFYVDKQTSMNIQLTKDTIKAAVIAGIWIPYFMQSVRVKNTFGTNAFSKTGHTENLAAAET